MLTQRTVSIKKHDPLIFQVLLNVVIDNLTLILRANAGKELLLSLWDSIRWSRIFRALDRM